MLDEFNETSPYYKDLSQEYNTVTSPDYKKLLITKRFDDMAKVNMVDYYNDFTDFEHKERLDKVENLRNDYVNRIDSHIEHNIPKYLKRPEESISDVKEELPNLGVQKNEIVKPKKEIKQLDANIELLKHFSKSDTAFLRTISQGILFENDFLGGVRKSVASTLAGIPQLVEDGLNSLGYEPDTLNEFNENTKDIIDSSFKSSGAYTTKIGDKEVDVVGTSGEVLGHFIAPVGTAKLVLNATKNAGKISKGLSLLASEAALGAITTDEDSGALLNIFYEKDEAERLYPMLRLIHVDEDDSAFEARMKGALENVLPIGAFGAAAGIIEGGKKATKSIKAIDSALISKYINKNPDSIIDYVSANAGKEFNNKDFKNKMRLDALYKGANYVYDQMYAFAKDEEGAIKIGFGPKKPEIEKIKNVASKKALQKQDEFNALSPELKESKEGFLLKDEISKLNQTNKDLDKFQKLFTKAEKEGKYDIELENIWNKIGLEMPDSIKSNKVMFPAKEELIQAKKRFDFMEDLKVEDETSFKAYQSVFNEKAIKDLTQNDFETGQFLSTVNKDGADLDELAARLASSDITAKEAQKIRSKFYNLKDIKKVSLEELKKRGAEVLEVYGYKADTSELSREGLLSIPEMVATNHILMKSGFQEFAARAKAFRNGIGGKGGATKRELQILAVNMIDAQSALHKIAHRSASLRSEVGQAMRAFRSDMLGKVALQATDKKFASINFSDPDFQLKFLEKLTSADPHELKRIAAAMKDVSDLMKKGDLSDVDAIRELARSGVRRKFFDNMQKYMYNNMLMSLSTLGRNFIGLSNAFALNRMTEAIQKIPLIGQGKNQYYGIAKDIDISFQKEILAATEKVNNNTESTMNLLVASKFLSGFRKADGTLKSSKDIFFDSFKTGHSMLDPGSEKVGTAAYRIDSFKEELDQVKELIGYNKFFGDKTDLDELALNQFKQNLLGDTKQAVEEVKTIPGKIGKALTSSFKGLGTVHSLPLRTMNAMDDMFKSKVVFEKMALSAKRQLNEKLSKMALSDEDAFKEYIKNIDDNYANDLKKYMNDIDNYENALAEARDLSLTKQYGGISQEDFKFAGMPLANLTEVFRKHPIMEFFHPFARISINMADYMTQYLPGIKGLSLNRFNSNIKADLDAGGYRAAKAHAKAHAGLALSSVAYMLASNGIITGDAPRDPYGRNAWAEAGIKPNSFNLKDTSIPLDVLEPMGRYFSFIANFHSAAMKALNNDDENFFERYVPPMIDLAIATASIATPETLSDMITFFKDITDADSKTLSYYINQKGSTALGKIVPFSSTIRQFKKSDSKTRLVEYDADGVDYLKTSINSFERVMVGDFFEQEEQPLKNLFNDQVYYHQLPKQIIGDVSDQNYINKFLFLPGVKQLLRPTQKRSEPIYEKIRELVLHLPEQNYKARDLAIPRLNRRLVFRNESVYLNNKQYNELIGYSNGYLPDGKTFTVPLKTYLNKLVTDSSFKSTAPDYQAQVIRSVIRQYQKVGRNIFKSRNKQFQEDIIKKIQ
tara:strand:+ start:1581 stop:6155 length:4575 start_codon:yes stop_codon:yes gene_type:complete